jgi:hypothetical protein
MASNYHDSLSCKDVLTKRGTMPRTWQTDEVIRCLADADQDELQELISEAGDEAAEALQEWVGEGNAPKSLYDAFHYRSQAFVRSR